MQTGMPRYAPRKLETGADQQQVTGRGARGAGREAGGVRAGSPGVLLGEQRGGDPASGRYRVSPAELAGEGTKVSPSHH